MSLKFFYYLIYFSIIIIVGTNGQSSSSLCLQYHPPSVHHQHQQCECDEISSNGTGQLSLKCSGHAYVPHFFPNVHYQLIELESCSQDLQVGDKTFADLNINTLRFRHCNLVGLNEESFAKINHLEKFSIENSTITSLSTSSGNFQDIFYSDSFQTLKSLTLNNVHYHQSNKHDKKFNFEFLLHQLPNLHRLELKNIFLDNYRFHNFTSIGQHLTYLKLINTHQTSLLPIDSLPYLESLILIHLPHIFHNQALISLIKNLKKLKYLDLTDNQLKNITDLQSKSIDQIDLTSNSIESIEEFTFEYVPKLRILTLTDNPLQTIHKNAFCGVVKLERLLLNTPKGGNPISPLDNCLLLSHPHLKIKPDNQAKLQCNCQLIHIYQLKRQKSRDINHLLTPNQMCIVTNNTLVDAKDSQVLYNHFNQAVHVYELENYLNCSIANPCDPFCQERKIRSTTIIIPINVHKSNAHVQGKITSRSISLFTFYSQTFLLLLLAFLYL